MGRPPPLIIAGLAATLAAGAVTAGVAGAAPRSAPTTAQRTITGAAPGTAFGALRFGAGRRYVVRRELAPARPGRSRRRRSLLYAAQLSDFQLADEESPARVEYLDPPGAPFAAAYRPQEALVPFSVDLAVRRLNQLTRSPLRQAGRRSRLAFALVTGDLADNQQLNEARWSRTLLEGGRLDPNSGATDPAQYARCPPGGPGPAEAPRYTGVQDYDDSGGSRYFYDPDRPSGPNAGFPAYPGLMDRAQRPFTAQGLKVPSYIALGNHDELVQGNAAASASFESLATGCVKPLALTQSPSEPLAAPDPATLAGLLAAPGRATLVPPDPLRRFADRAQMKAVYRGGRQADGHGFRYVDAAEQAASRGEAAYYSFSPRRRLRLIALDTNSHAGVPGVGGSIDRPQLRWLEGQLRAAARRDELVIAFGHTPLTNLASGGFTDEMGPACASRDAHGHYSDPGCDSDPRPSTPLAEGAEVTALLGRYPGVVAYVAGDTHTDRVTPLRGRAGGFWQIETSSETDWPQQSRLIELFDNRDGTLSLAGTMVDQAAPPAAPRPGNAAGFSTTQLASLSRTLAYEDPQSAANGNDGTPAGRNVELLLSERRRSGGCALPGKRPRGTRLGPARLGRARSRLRRRLGPPVTRRRRGTESYCLRDGSRLLAGYGRRAGKSTGGRRHRGRAVLLAGSSAAYRYRGVGSGARAGRALRRMRARAVGRGPRRSRWYVARGRRARVLVQVRRGRIARVGLMDRHLPRGRRGVRRTLRALGLLVRARPGA